MFIFHREIQFQNLRISVILKTFLEIKNQNLSNIDSDVEITKNQAQVVKKYSDRRPPKTSEKMHKEAIT